MIDFPLPAAKGRQMFSQCRLIEWPLIDDLIKKAESKGGYIRVRLDLPSRQKTSPENRLFYAIATALAAFQGVSLETMKRYIKLYAATVHNYDCETVEIAGKVVIEPKSIALATNEDMVDKLIPTCYELGMDWGCPLEQSEV
jgi:hypothetical protein